MTNRQEINSTTPAIALGLSLLFLLTSITAPVFSQTFRERMKARRSARQESKTQFQNIEHRTIAGLNVAIWYPKNTSAAPLVIFSHGLHGTNTQSAFLMQAMADAGYIVVAPNHKDAMSMSNLSLTLKFKPAKEWTDKTYDDRGADIRNLVKGLHSDESLNKRIDWSKVALCGHSLGGYTSLACAGAYPSWKIADIKAVLVLSPYVLPLVENGGLEKISAPVMYEGGTMDVGITPSISKPNGAYDQTAKPVSFVEFTKAGHLYWTGLNRDPQKRKLICDYSVAFLNKCLKADNSFDFNAHRDGVEFFKSK